MITLNIVVLKWMDIKGDRLYYILYKTAAEQWNFVVLLLIWCGCDNHLIFRCLMCLWMGCETELAKLKFMNFADRIK